MATIAVVVAVAIVLCGLASAQTLSTSNSPVKVLGKFTCTQSADVQEGHQLTRVTGVGPVSLQNVSSKRIIAFVVKIDASCGYIGTHKVYSHDMIYKAMAMPVGDMMALPVEVDEGRTGDVGFQSGTLSVVPQFIQFEDGSTWGDSSLGAPFGIARSDAYSWQANLRSISDDTEFNAELNKPVDPASMVVFIQRSLQITRDQSGLATVRTTIDDRMATYNARIANGKF
jgi:hypothetical protein